MNILSKIKSCAVRFFKCISSCFGKEYISAHCLNCGKLYKVELDMHIVHKLRYPSMWDKDNRCSCYDEKITEEKLDRIVNIVLEETHPGWKFDGKSFVSVDHPEIISPPVPEHLEPEHDKCSLCVHIETGK